jgi:hypothetical protein
MASEASKLQRQTSKMKAKAFQRSTDVTYDLFQVVRDGNVQLLDRLLDEERKTSDSRSVVIVVVVVVVVTVVEIVLVICYFIYPSSTTLPYIYFPVYFLLLRC